MIEEAPTSPPNVEIPQNKIPEPIVATTVESVAEIPKSISKSKSSGIKLPNLSEVRSGNYKIKREEEGEEKQDLPMQSFSKDDFLSTWEKCLQALRAKNQTSLNVMLQSIQLEQKTEVCWSVFFQNKIQQEIFQAEKVNILTFLREQLQNYAIDFEFEIKESNTKLTPYTNVEKFKAMAEINPVLIEMKEKLGLDLG